MPQYRWPEIEIATLIQYERAVLKWFIRRVPNMVKGQKNPSKQQAPAKMKKQTSKPPISHSSNVEWANDSVPLIAGLVRAFLCGVTLAATALILGYGPMIAFTAYSFGGSVALAVFAVIKAVPADYNLGLARFNWLIGAVRR